MQATDLTKPHLAPADIRPAPGPDAPAFGAWQPLETLPPAYPDNFLVKLEGTYADGSKAVTWDVAWLVPGTSRKKGRIDGPWHYTDGLVCKLLAWMPGPAVGDGAGPAARLAA
jgi:hypothetical protein